MAGAAARRVARLNTPGAAPAARLLLDALRGASALVVFAAHAAFFWLDAYPSLTLPGKLLHAAELAVIVFFVVSGYVIVASMLRRAASSDDGRLDLARFARDRARRLLPPLALALVVTTLCHAYLLAAGPSGYADYWSARLALGVGLFLQGLTSAFDVPLANGPLWSLAHEGWFYVVGAALFARRPPLLIAVAALVLVLAGGASLGLVPATFLGERSAHWLPGFVVWCAGGTLALGAHAGRLPALEHRALVAITLVLCVSLIVTALADAFAARYAFGLALAALLASWLPVLASSASASRLVRPLTPFAAIAPFSYTLYVLHYPLVLAWNVATDRWQQSPHGLAATLALGTLGVVALCAITARRVERVGRVRARGKRC